MWVPGWHHNRIRKYSYLVINDFVTFVDVFAKDNLNRILNRNTYGIN
jgi:hypothetical protein